MYSLCPLGAVASAVAVLALLVRNRPLRENAPLVPRNVVTGYAVLALGVVANVVLFSLSWGAVAQRRAADPSYPRLSDATLALWSFAALGLSRVALVPLFEALGRNFISKTQWAHEWESRVQRFGAQLWKLLFHTLMVALPLALFGATEWYPPTLAGCSAEALYAGYPHVAQVPWLREFYMAQLGYYVLTTAATLLMPWRANFAEMMLHHAAAFTLISVSYFVQNNARLGSLVLFVHDVCDIPICFTRCVVDSQHRRVTAAGGAVMLGTWAWFRLAVFPLGVMRLASVAPFVEGAVRWGDAHAWGPLTALLCVLLALNAHWFGEMVRMVLHMQRTGKSVDTVENGRSADDRAQPSLIRVVPNKAV
eukprot:m51a1_g8062 putative longevity-assurance family protein (365) ;mRNA; f:142157-143580